MTTAQIDLVEPAGRFAPGAVVEGVASWSLDEAPRSVTIALVWHTEGKGTRDDQVVHRERIADADASDARTFSFTLPPTPWSFSGKLISVLWAIELVIDRARGADMVTQQAITVSASGTEVDLTALTRQRGSDPPR